MYNRIIYILVWRDGGVYEVVFIFIELIVNCIEIEVFGRLIIF